MARISASVGRGGMNRRQDVIAVQTLINDNIQLITPTPALKVDGVVGSKTIDLESKFII